MLCALSQVGHYPKGLAERTAVVQGCEEVRIQVPKLGHSDSSGGEGDETPSSSSFAEPIRHDLACTKPLAVSVARHRKRCERVGKLFPAGTYLGLR